MDEQPLAMVVYGPDTAARQRAAKRGRPGPSANAGAMVPYSVVPPFGDFEPVSAVPLSAIAPQLPQAPWPIGEEPPCLRKHILPALKLRADLPVNFIAEKTVTGTDLDAHQNRFRIPTDGVLRRLRPILTPEELDSANLLHDPPPKPRRQAEPEPVNGTAENVGEQVGRKRKKKQGKVHGGLPVKLVGLAAGASWELRLSRWESSRGTIVKGEGYLDFIRWCSFKEKDVVEIWAFKQRAFRNFGVNLCDESPLHLLIVKRDDMQPKCSFCPRPR